MPGNLYPGTGLRRQTSATKMAKGVRFKRYLAGKPQVAGGNELRRLHENVEGKRGQHVLGEYGEHLVPKRQFVREDDTMLAGR